MTLCSLRRFAGSHDSAAGCYSENAEDFGHASAASAAGNGLDKHRVRRASNQVGFGNRAGFNLGSAENFWKYHQTAWSSAIGNHQAEREYAQVGGVACEDEATEDYHH